MENPATWNEIQKLIHQVIQENDDNSMRPDPAIGASLPTQIYRALKEAGFLNLPIEVYKQENPEEGYYSR